MFLFRFYFGNKFPKITEIIISERFFMMRIRGDSGHKIHNCISHNLEVGGTGLPDQGCVKIIPSNLELIFQTDFYY